MYDKYGMIILAWMPIIMFFFATFIAFIGILVIKRIETPIVWLGVSYVLIFALKLRFTTLLDSSKYTRSYKLITTVITLTAYFLVLPAMLTALAIAFRDLNAKVLLIIPLINYTAFKFFSSISILYNSYKGFQERPSGFQLFLFRCVY
ncbi:hypothetical protein Ctaglu_46300 [Clostridium tagluense]|uniref:Uncharacterized protein n=2 Tax=Clostridium tagluense TaxID=360422 RepID=A0A401UTZ4_9CLOT|nr:hypothetical protein Ctaglu_46300 [Clostridium tagluense]